MNRQVLIPVLLLSVCLSGCHPIQPFYMNQRADLSSYLDQDTQISEPDLEHHRLREAEETEAPLLLSNPEHRKEWDLTLEEAIAIALHNSKVIRSLAQVRQPANIGGLNSPSGVSFANRTGGATSIYDPAIQETDPNAGLYAALSNFDAQFTTNVFWQKTERPQNVTTGTLDFPDVLLQDQAQVDMGLSKPTANGTVYSLRSQTIYDQNNRGFGRAQPSDWLQTFEFEVSHPLFRNRGTQVNRIPIILARLNTDISLSTFNSEVRNLLFDVEKTYWDLRCQYRELEAAKKARDSAQLTWKFIYAKRQEGVETIQAEAQAREQFYFFTARVQTAWRDLLNTENNLRYLMGIAATDNAILRPIDEPAMAKMQFEWREVLTEMLHRRAELRQQKWIIKRRELELVAARNQLLPELNVVALYRWLGLGDDFAVSDRRGLNFPQRGSLAWDELTEGRYGEWRIGLDFTPPRIGARRELANVRNAQLNLIRDKERLREMELNISHTLTQVIRNMDSHYVLAKTHFNRWEAADEEVRSVMELYVGNKLTLDRVLEAQRRRADSQIEYYRALCEYNKSLAEVHFSKGSLLDMHNVQLSEGPWPKKAYWDALGRARERDASQTMNYGWTRPNVVSRGALGTQVETLPAQATDGEPQLADPAADDMNGATEGDGQMMGGQGMDDVPPPQPSGIERMSPEAVNGGNTARWESRTPDSTQR